MGFGRCKFTAEYNSYVIWPCHSQPICQDLLQGPPESPRLTGSLSASLSPCPFIIHSSESGDDSPGDPQVNVAMDAQNKDDPTHSSRPHSYVLLSQEEETPPSKKKRTGVCF